MTKYNLLVVLIILFACKGERKSDTNKKGELQDQVEEPCINDIEKKEAIEAILNTKDFQNFLHPELSERLPIKLERTDFISEDLNLVSNGHKIIIQWAPQELSEYTVRLRIFNVDCGAKRLEYSIFYPIEGATISGNAKIQNDEWIAYVTQIGED